MSWAQTIPALMLGLLSSFHCVGMCGAIAFTLPLQAINPSRKLPGILLYNAGRITTYSLLGLLFGLAGRQLYLAGLQSWLSVAAGIGMLGFVVYLAVGRVFTGNRFVGTMHVAVQKIISRHIHKTGPFHFFLIGVANGLLPCGMVYFAVAGALSTGNVKSAVAFMLLFGVGTAPAMILLSYYGYRIRLSYRERIRKTLPFVIGLVGVLFVLRGMGLNIPYVSPMLPGPQRQVVSCH
ncbi:sulfite exporter TauE/SafE family protein [Foetidibacter luteolus]|uniref:sulfite exporter TauE/SafE family protein n=1 Tax=Foetidibacter luteolus TaxID=2608880 RepID=UPI00129BB635|nr:sulfite exporter TauE/SafE family protein [Foetidibacter luteolus]